jgi:hypothetical protein
VRLRFFRHDFAAPTSDAVSAPLDDFERLMEWAIDLAQPGCLISWIAYVDFQFITGSSLCFPGTTIHDALSLHCTLLGGLNERRGDEVGRGVHDAATIGLNIECSRAFIRNHERGFLFSMEVG